MDQAVWSELLPFPIPTRWPRAPASPSASASAFAMITHHPSLLRPPILTRRVGVLGRRPALHAFLSAAVASARPSTPPLRLRPVRAAASQVAPNPKTRRLGFSATPWGRASIGL